MKTENIQIATILTSKRIRESVGNIEELQESIETFGLLQPIGVRVVEGGFELIWGGRRLAALKQLGRTEVPAHVLECAEDYRLRELELEENIRRKDMTWQEQVLSMHEIHTGKKMHNALIGESWGYRETGALLGISLGNVSYSLTAAEAIRQGDAEVSNARNLTEAISILLKKKEAELLAQKGAGTAEKGDRYFSDDAIQSFKEASTKRTESGKQYTIKLADPCSAHTQVFELGSTLPWYSGEYGFNFISFISLFDREDIQNYGTFLGSMPASCYQQLYVLQDVSAKGNGMPLKDQLYAAVMVSTIPPKNTDTSQDAIVRGNNFPARVMMKSAVAMDTTFIQQVYRLWVPSENTIGFPGQTCNAYVMPALFAGHVAVLHKANGIAESMQPYGSVHEI